MNLYISTVFKRRAKEKVVLLMTKRVWVGLLALIVSSGISFSVQQSVSTSQSVFDETLVDQKADYIVGYADDKTGELASLPAKIGSALKRQVTVKDTIEGSLVNAKVVSISRSEAKALKAAIPGLSVSKNIEYASPEAVETPNVNLPETLGVRNDSQSTMNVNGYANVLNKGKGIKIGVLDTGLYADHVYVDGVNPADDTYPVFRPLAANELNDTSYTKEEADAKIKTIGFGKYVNSKIIYQWDVADDDANVSGAGNHGTHVASLLAANNGTKYQGVAPYAQLAILKVFGSGGTAATSAILKGMNIADQLGLDQINLSLGSALFDDPDAQSPDALSTQTIKRLQANGTLVNFAAGNDGYEQWSLTFGNALTTQSVEDSLVGSFAALEAPTIVASTTLDHIPLNALKLGTGQSLLFNDSNPAAYFSDFLKDKSVAYAYLGDTALGVPEDYKDVSGKIAVVHRGSIPFTEKIANAQKAGAVGLIIVNTDDQSLSIAVGDATIPVAVVKRSDLPAFQTNPTGTITFESAFSENPLKRTVSDFSSNGGTTYLSIGPDIAAPGSEIWAAVNNNYEPMSGTSMATPNLTGALALLLSNHTSTAEELTAYKNSVLPRIQSTASPVQDIEEKEGTDDANYASPRLQGAGLINVDKAASSKVYLEGTDLQGAPTGKAALELRQSPEIAKGQLKANVLIHNESTQSVTYNVTAYLAAPQVGKILSETEWNSLSGTLKDNSNPNIVNTGMKFSYDHYLGTVDLGQAVAPAQKTTTLSLDKNLNADQVISKYVDQYLGGNSVIEGYLKFTPVTPAEGIVDLNMPYTGFFGDYGKPEAVEPFDFERDDTKIYNSDLINTLAKSLQAYTNPYADYASAIYGGTGITSWNDAAFALAYNWIGQTSLTSNGFHKLGYDKTLEQGQRQFTGGKLIAGAPGQTDKLLVQLFVERNIQDGTVELYKDGQPVTGTKSPIFGFPNGSDVSGVFSTQDLIRSRAFGSAITSGYFVPMAGAFVDLSPDQNVLPEGDYEIRLTFHLMAQTYQDGVLKDVTQTKSVPLTISHKRPSIANVASGVLTTTADVRYVIYPSGKKQLVDGSQSLALDQSEAENGKLSLTLVGQNGGRTQLLLDVVHDGAYALVGDVSDVNAFVFDVIASGKTTAIHVSAYDSKGQEAANYFGKDHGFIVKLDSKPTIDSVVAIDHNGNKIALDASQISYDGNTGYLTVTGLASGVATIEVTVK